MMIQGQWIDDTVSRHLCFVRPRHGASLFVRGLPKTSEVGCILWDPLRGFQAMPPPPKRCIAGLPTLQAAYEAMGQRP
jgi:hypothetical protein